MERIAKRVHATGAWTFVIGSEFQVLDNGDSVQAVQGQRIVYVSSLQVGTDEAPVGATQIRTAAARKLGSSERLSHVGDTVEGDAEIRRDGDILQLHGTMCADGTLATCVIDFASPSEQAWAEEVWRSLLCDSAST